MVEPPPDYFFQQKMDVQYSISSRAKKKTKIMKKAWRGTVGQLCIMWWHRSSSCPFFFPTEDVYSKHPTPSGDNFNVAVKRRRCCSLSFRGRGAGAVKSVFSFFFNGLFVKTQSAQHLLEFF